MTNKPFKQLSDEDQAKVDGYLRRGYNDTPRKGFKPFLLLLFLLVVVWGLGAGAVLIGRLSGISG